MPRPRAAALAFAIMVATTLAAAQSQARPYRHHVRHAAHHHSVPWLARAFRHYGRNPTGWARVWCGRFMRMVVPRDPGSRYNLARNWRYYGVRASGGIGDIAVMRGHVGIVTGHCDRGVRVISGNHGRRVGEGCYARRRIIAYRRP